MEDKLIEQEKAEEQHYSDLAEKDHEDKMKNGKTLIQVSNDLWSILNSKKTPGEKTFEDVIRRLLK